MTEPKGVRVWFEGRETFKDQLDGLFREARKYGLGLSADIDEVNRRGAKLWEQLQGMQDLAEVGMGAVVYCLRRTEVPDINQDTKLPYKLWQRAQFGEQDGIPLRIVEK